MDDLGVSDETWSRHFEGDQQASSEILVAYQSLVVTLASVVYRRLDGNEDFDELVQEGCVGLIQALDRYQRGGARFKTFAQQRIQGAMVDGLRRKDWISRSMRARITVIMRARDRLETMLGRAPTEKELSREAGLTLEQVAEASRFYRHPDSLDDLIQIADEASMAPFSDIELAQTLSWAISRLPRDHRRALWMHYVEGMPFSRIAEVQGVDHVTARRRHKADLERLRRMLAA